MAKNGGEKLQPVPAGGEQRLRLDQSELNPIRGEKSPGGGRLRSIEDDGNDGE